MPRCVAFVEFQFPVYVNYDINLRQHEREGGWNRVREREREREVSADRMRPQRDNKSFTFIAQQK